MVALFKHFRINLITRKICKGQTRWLLSFEDWGHFVTLTAHLRLFTFILFVTYGPDEDEPMTVGERGAW